MPFPAMRLRATDLAWAAGILDGEGYIGIQFRGGKVYGTHQVAVVVVNSSRNMVERLLALFGGSVCRQGKLWAWSAGQAAAANMLERCRRYMVGKADQAWLALEFLAQRQVIRGNRREGRGSPSISDEERALREGFRLALKGLHGGNR